MNGVASASSTAIKGLEDHGDDTGVKHCTATVLAAIRLAAVTARLLYDNAKEALRGKRDVLATAIDAARKFATIARDNLKPIFGSEYHEGWDGPGFVGSLAVPKTYEDLLPLMEALVSFFTENPTYEVEDRNVTAAQAQLVCTALKDAFNAIAAQEASMKILMNDRDTKFTALRDKLVQLVDELSHLMDPLDPRWIAFGFNMPGAQQTPDEVEGVQATLIGPTAVALKWNASARAAYYRVFKKVIGTDEDYIPVGSPADLDFTIEGLPANATVEIQVSAVNNGGESPRTSAVTVVTHA